MIKSFLFIQIENTTPVKTEKTVGIIREFVKSLIEVHDYKAHPSPTLASDSKKTLLPSFHMLVLIVCPGMTGFENLTFIALNLETSLSAY